MKMGIALLMAGLALCFGLFGLMIVFVLQADKEERERQKEDDESGTEY